MDTCSRLGEPGGVGWKDVNVGRLRTTTSGKRLIWWLRAAARSGRWPRNLACAIPCCGVGWSNVGLGGSRRRRRGTHNAGDAAVGGPRGGDRSPAARERAAAYGARHFKKVDRDLCWDADIEFRFIEDRRADYPVTILCDVLAVSPAGYYAWRSRPESRRSAQPDPLSRFLEKLLTKSASRRSELDDHDSLKNRSLGSRGAMRQPHDCGRSPSTEISNTTLRKGGK